MPDGWSVPQADTMDSSIKHVIATLSVCAGIVAVTAWALIAMSPVA
ncbi:hypothetical protein GCM10009769_31390 [Curtobacterium luteum]|uniref:Uncharacterized protein n=2 Tax=Curtobacterium luteum TaxID=33881 RepID=A0A8H9L1R6_9MICO|nr:hypothetical protein GCM10009769_31390 [Curtobacterium luteum]